MEESFPVAEIDVGCHPRGYRIDKTATPLNRYTRWELNDNGMWSNPVPVCFDALPEDGWMKCTGFDW
ncbi:MAG: hypothetical protein GF418_02335 [Chitinivibrionales bacterium]|nr:hypothetical protein [Chitinivibrionales bacterium]MBD3394439.1 hypothetical protein [Chitinivibrionales bacterium]